MFICVCKGVSDTRIRRAVEQGAVLTLRDLSREMGVGTCCGKCVPAAREVLDRALARPVASSCAPNIAYSPLQQAAASA